MHLYVITPIVNPLQFQSRARLYREFRKHVHDSGATLITVEAAFGERPFECTETNDAFDLQLRTSTELWHKEQMINRGIMHLTRQFPEWKYVAWIDADVHFHDPAWVKKTLDALQHYKVIQLFSHAIDLGPRGEPIQSHRSFMSMYHENYFYPPVGPGSHGYYCTKKDFWHPGYAWAARRESLNELGLLYNTAILGSGDHHMAMALIGEVKRSFPGGITHPYMRSLLEWQSRAEREIRRDVGFIPGTLTHSWHGKKKDRKYVERWDILTKNKFNPDRDIKLETSGLYTFDMEQGLRMMRLRDETRAYFRQRNEDSIDL